jgi:tetratricopeptide (TPR) repeat protein
VALDSTYVPAREGLLRYYVAAPGVLGGSLDRAREQADAIGKLNPYRGGLAHANVAVAAKDTAALIRAHESLVAQFPDSVAPHFALYNVHLARRQYAPAWSVVDRLEQLRSAPPVVRYAIGRAAAESGEQLDRGEQSLRAYLQHTPGPNEVSHAVANWRLGMIAEKRGNKAAARESFEAALKLDPNFRQAKEALARLR